VFNIMSGKYSAEGTLFQIFSLIVTTVHDPIFARFEFSFDKQGRIARLSAKGALETDVEPIKNPVTGSPHRIQVKMPEGRAQGSRSGIRQHPDQPEPSNSRRRVRTARWQTWCKHRLAGPVDSRAVEFAQSADEQFRDQQRAGRAQAELLRQLGGEIVAIVEKRVPQLSVRAQPLDRRGDFREILDRDDPQVGLGYRIGEVVFDRIEGRGTGSTCPSINPTGPPSGYSPA
jgi:hypothetical protein